MGATSIEWTRGDDGSQGSTWNPIRGTKGRHICQRISPGCQHCYAATMNVRFSGIDYVAGADTPRLDEDALTQPLRWKRGRRVFVCSMTDLFWDQVPDAWIDRIFATMLLTQRHTYLILTKRPERMRAYLTAPDHLDRVLLAMDQLLGPKAARWADMDGSSAFPCPAIWLGTSVEDQAAADSRIPLLLQTPAAVRFLSVEPMLGPVDLGLGRWIHLPAPVRSELPFVRSYLPAGIYRATSNPHGALSVQHETTDGLLGVKPVEFERLPMPSWVIAGGESGPGARPCDLAWLRSIVAQCRAAGTSVFVKQLGAVISGSWDDNASQPHGLAMTGTVRTSDGVERCRWFVRDRKGGDIAEFPDDLKVREFPNQPLVANS